MSGEDTLDPRNLTFPQAYGYEELPQTLKLEEVSDEARTKLWSELYMSVRDHSSLQFGHESPVGSRWWVILMFLHMNFHLRPADEFESSIQAFIDIYQSLFMNAPFNRVFDLLLAILRHPDCPRDLRQSVATVFVQCGLAYAISIHDPVVIYPAATEEEGKAILGATDELSNAGLASAVTHLRQASGCINQGDYPGAVRESIHAVESTARQISPNTRTLDPALSTLEKSGALHPAMKKAFSNLYGYTSDEQGIRHALIDNPRPNVGRDEAVFMLGACASFSSYLARKHHTPTS